MCIFFYPFLASVQQLQLERRRLLQVHDQPVPESALRQLEDGVGWPLLRPIQGRALRIQRRVLFRVQHRRRRRRRRRTPATAIARSQHVHDQGRSQAQLWRRFLNRETKKMKRNLEFEIAFFSPAARLRRKKNVAEKETRRYIEHFPFQKPFLFRIARISTMAEPWRVPLCLSTKSKTCKKVLAGFCRNVEH